MDDETLDECESTRVEVQADSRYSLKILSDSLAGTPFPSLECPLPKDISHVNSCLRHSPRASIPPRGRTFDATQRIINVFNDASYSIVYLTYDAL